MPDGMKVYMELIMTSSGTGFASGYRERQLYPPKLCCIGVMACCETIAILQAVRPFSLLVLVWWIGRGQKSQQSMIKWFIIIIIIINESFVFAVRLRVDGL